jgi:membrane peptidoglycan carboxypeptidase
VEPTLFTHITTEDGSTLVDNHPLVTTAFTPDVAADLTTALTEVVKRGTGQQALIGRPVAGKTGTSQEHRDAWFVGYTPDLAAAVWVGMPEATTPMEPPLTPYAITGGTWPAQIWSRFAAAALSATPFGQLPTADADGMVSVDVDLSTGFLAGPLCPRSEVHRIQLPADQVPTVICPVHNPRGLVEVGTGTVPDVIGGTLSEAVMTLEQAGFEARVDWQPANGLTPETVFGQQPAAGLPAHAGGIVTLTVTGPDPSTVAPSLLGLSRSGALDLLARRGMRSVVTVEAETVAEDAERRAGLVWKQEPAAGEVAGGVIRVWINPS